MDIYDWILSPEIRNYLGGYDPMSLQEKAKIICSACRPMEDKCIALRTLLDETETGEDRKILEQLLRLYQWELEELRRVRPGQIFICEKITYGDVTCLWEKVDRMFFTYEEVLEYLENLGEPEPGSGYFVAKWVPDNNNIEEIIRLYFCMIDGTLQATKFWLVNGSDRMDHELDIGVEARSLHEWCTRCIEFLIPFQSGDLVRLDFPNMDAIYGILYTCGFGYGRNMWLFYVSNDSLEYRALDYYWPDRYSNWCIMDCLYSASASELPSGQEILAELSQAFHLADRNTDESELLLDRINILLEHSIQLSVPVCYKTPLTLSGLLVQADGEK